MSNKDLICFILTSIDKEMPKDTREVWMAQASHGHIPIKRFAEFSFPELMEEYMCHIGENYQYVLLNGVPHYKKFGSTDNEYFKPKELFNDFLTQKGIL